MAANWMLIGICGVALVLVLGAETSKADIDIDLGRGPVTVHVPPSYDPAVPMPVVVLLHGYTSTGEAQEAYMQFQPLADEYGFLYLYPDGTEDDFGYQFWNATNACCDLFNSGVDDSAYLRSLLDEVKAQLSVDPLRVYLIGHSNGGFMSYRMACDHADTIAAIASLAGATWLNSDICTPSEPVHVLQIHGTDDTVIRYNGGCIFGSGCYPGAVISAEYWAMYDACTLETTEGDPLDLDRLLPGDETSVTRYEDQCLAGGSAELWTIDDGSHSPFLSDDFAYEVIDFLFAHSKPAGPCDGDVNSDGQVDPLDAGYVLGRFGCPVGAGDGDCDSADATSDEVVDPLDVGYVLARFGSCG